MQITKREYQILKAKADALDAIKEILNSKEIIKDDDKKSGWVYQIPWKR